MGDIGLSMEAGEIFAKRVKSRLEALDWTQSDLARRLKIGPKGISKVLQERRAPRIDTLLRWADALGVSVEYLLGRDANAAPAPKPSDEAIRLACITAVTLATTGQLSTIRDAIPGDLLQAALDQNKRAALG